MDEKKWELMFGKENGASVMEIDGKKRFLPDSGDVRMEFEWVGYRDFYEDPVMVKGNKGEGMSRWPSIIGGEGRANRATRGFQDGDGALTGIDGGVTPLLWLSFSSVRVFTLSFYSLSSHLWGQVYPLLVYLITVNSEDIPMAVLAWNVRAGVLALWWSKDSKIKILGYGKHFIDAEISTKGEPEWCGTFIYGLPYKEQKKEFWEFMKNLGNGHGDKWLVIGDSNVVSSQDEKLGGLPFNPNDANSYFEFFDSRGLIDMPISGGAFTWSIKEATMRPYWRNLTGCYVPPNGIYSFLKWCWEPISQSRNSHRFGSKLRRTKYTLIRWSKLKDHVKNQRKIELQRRIEYYQGKQLTKEELSDSKDCKKELDVTWENEERYWHQGRESTGCNIVTRSGLKTLMRWSSTFNNTSKEFTQGIRRSTMVGWRT
ncbi:hypothetical protein V6N12_068905 [Hibiscus sabdariffa]|uniref:Uncharacterized protein n=1 Tax=Hibiscus sabdariffa TaxID=183260 RepID=A0ABR2CC47_9ROSI